MTSAGDVYAALGRRIREVGERKGVEYETMRRLRSIASAAQVGEPPVSRDGLEDIARRLEIDEVSSIPLASNGRLRLSGARLILEVNAELSEFEQRFTLAHELTHRVVEASRVAEARLTGRPNREGTAHAERTIEEICDLGAGELLLPESWVLQHVDYETTTATLAALAEELAYPLEFLLARVFELGIWKGWCLSWDVDESRAFPLRAPTRFGHHFKSDNVQRAGTIGHTFLRRAAVGHALIRGTLELRFGTQTEAYVVEAFRSADGATVLTPVRIGV